MATLAVVPAFCPPALGLELFRAESLTVRESQVLALLSAGLTDQQISTALLITHRTVRAHISQVYLKLGTSARVTAGLVGYLAHRATCQKCQ